MLIGKDSLNSHERVKFEGERLCLLIDSKIRRKEFGIARDLAAELFKVDAKAALLQRAERVRKLSKVLQKTSLLMLGAFASLIFFMTMNIRPLLDLKLGLFVLSFMLVVITLNVILLKNYKKRLRSLALTYESAKADFVSRVLGNVKDCKKASQKAGEVFLSSVIHQKSH